MRITKDNFDSLFREYYPSAVIFARKYSNDIESAKDIAQQVFVNFYEKMDKIEIQGSFKAYLFTAVRNTSLNQIKKQKTDLQHSGNLVHRSEDIAISDALEYDEFVQKINKIIDELPPRCKEIFRMNRFDGKKNGEIAEKLKISKRTVETQISQAIKHLRKRLPTQVDVILFILGITTCFLN